MATQTPRETLERLGALTFGTELEYNRISRDKAAVYAVCPGKALCRNLRKVIEVRKR